MNKAGGYIAIHRRIADWEWFKDSHTVHLFLYLLVSANFADAKFLGKKIRRGQVVTSLAHLAESTGLSVQNVKTALKHLILTGEVTNVSNRQYRIITIAKYDEYQDLTNIPTNDLTNNQQTANKRLTNDQQQYKKNKKNKKNKNNKREGTFVPPSREQVETFCNDKNIQIDVDRFLDYYTSNGWMVGRNRMKSWEAAVRNWARRDREAPVRETRKDVMPAQEYHQRDYSDAQEAAFQRMMDLGGDEGAV